jgi:hypothetical protein
MVDRKIKSWMYQSYEKDSYVEYKGKFYVGLEERNYVEPTNLYANWFYVRNKIFNLHLDVIFKS